MKAAEIVRRYAATLLDAAGETGIPDQVHRDVEGLQATLQASAELLNFLRDRLVDAQLKGRALEQLFSGKVQALTLNFLLLLAQRRRVELLPEILEACAALFDARQGTVNAEVRSTVELSPQQCERFRQRLEAHTGKRVRLHARVDKSLRGGAIARVGDTVFDGSLVRHLERLHEQLAGGKITKRS